MKYLILLASLFLVSCEPDSIGGRPLVIYEIHESNNVNNRIYCMSNQITSHRFIDTIGAFNIGDTVKFTK